MRLRDRSEAGRELARHLGHLRGMDPVVLALPRGGVPVAFEVAGALGAPLNLLLVRKIGAPGFAELAVGAVVDGARPETVVNEEVVRNLNVSTAYLEREATRELAEIERRRAL
jgi:putative phosphoribosyl transferase